MSLRIHRDKGHLHAGGLGPQLAHRLGQALHGLRAYVRAVGVAEEQGRHGTLLVRQAPRFAVLVCQLKVWRRALGLDGEALEGRRGILLRRTRSMRWPVYSWVAG